ncbi:MAG: hypothetical protein ACRDF6_08395, partial [bacterium]
MIHFAGRVVLILFLVVAHSAEAQELSGSTPDSVDPAGAPHSFEGPPAPIEPAVITRDDEGRATVRAVRLREPLRIDGALDEAHYQT